MEVSSEPYPPIEGIREDCVALRIISPAYAGRDGELTAVLQYVYQSVLLDACGRGEASKRLIEIAATEMRHVEILGTLITHLGAPPMFTACPPYPVGYYSASFVNYTRDPQHMIEADICMERASIERYESMLTRLTDPRVRAVIARIAEDEKEHLCSLEALLREAVREG